MTNTVATFSAFWADRVAASDAYVEGDLAPLAAISAEQAPASIFPPTGAVIAGPDSVDAFNEQGAKLFAPGATNDFEVTHTGESGDLAYWVGVQRSRVRLHGLPEPVDMALRLTEIFRRDQGEWKLVHRHADRTPVDA